MADEELQIEEEGGGKKSKMMLIIIIAVVLIGGGAGAYFFLFAGGDEPAAEALAEGEEGAAAEGEGEAPEAAPASGSAEVGTALYVALPQPLLFHIPGSGRERTVQIKIQLLVRGTDNEETAKVNIPLIQGRLLQVFSSSNADDLVTEAGKIELREKALEEVQSAMKEYTGSEVVEQVLFTGFVMQ
ncbi:MULTISPECIES: flagellar basal body-associated protein FliL [unclassified Alteromonas]|uniref:flagellar basal body-associated protein FliL n=1 Tax=unclassified Alteromonas TaxID=2614992 RepID=UPI000C597963|nr:MULTISPECIES: flagellar basal body-associated protein FliL [unclassified Alteromonas]AYA63695.1 flagellar basal body-associated protein FliL [Alteromonas sp. RKMC-009]MBT80930.1 flagellar basal body-associated protein FliL [Alteromonadaceae bacterium]MDO6476465.1 flagellar basal body-associated protein FliL [Alteromonas sp. 1_MG-2023]MEC7690975.1 flagellar basal body-associated protein FliL [Pseudomonadota bacterium]